MCMARYVYIVGKYKKDLFQLKKIIEVLSCLLETGCDSNVDLYFERGSALACVNFCIRFIHDEFPSPGFDLGQEMIDIAHQI